ncbi:glycosyltransferase family 2 protein [Acinetobacter nosocomialis]|uniref:glycosyltransferase family 2 protein n=1 Tax=Acinetobacter nosocomialis TaxID=106654 RepID=UPI001B81B7D0|nr:glycosyltransferase family 2 protein [Acinetobacter nosocomialis]MBR7718233.1 glycosyltransferase family 2 protein [Acinetobacter nosocomialis]
MRIKAIIVTFNPKANVVNLINNLKRQNVTPIIVDNGSINFDFKIIENDLDCYLIRLYENFGIATAQNKGIEKALELGTDYILFFDQDSTISDNFVNDILNDYSFLSRKNITIGALGPRFIDERNKFYYKSIGISKYGLRTKYDVSNISEPFHSYLLISSGSLVSVDTLKNVGLMRDKYFIDYVDTEWCIRAESKGYNNYMSAKAIMYHTIGDNIKQNKWFKMPVHSSFRRYYIIRNSFYMLKEPYIPKLFVFHQLFINIIHQFIIIYVAKGNRFNYLKSFLRGVKDGLKYLI